MAEQYYTVPENPVYDDTQIRKIQDTDPVRASTIVNPVLEKLIENTAATRKEGLAHTGNDDVHVTEAQKTTWDGKAPGSLSATVSGHTGNGDIHVTAADKTKWNGYQTVHTLGYTKSGTQHRLTGLTGLSGTLSCVFKATAAFAAGDTFTVDGTAYAVQLSNGETAEDNLFVNGASILIVVDTAGKKVNFKKAGGPKLPAGTVVLKTTASTTFVVPETGNYKITVVGHGGHGGSSSYYVDYDTGYSRFSIGGGGGSGGIATGTFKLTKGQSITVTVTTATSSFGSLISATAGQEGDGYSYRNYSWVHRDGCAGGTATGGSYSSSGQNGVAGKLVDSDTLVQSVGGSGGAYTTTNRQYIPFLSTTRLRGNKYSAIIQDQPKDTDVGLGGGGQCDNGSTHGVPGANGLVLVEKA